MMETNQEERQLVTRINDLDRLLQSRHADSCIEEFLFTTDGLLDALLALYDECTNDKLQFNKCARGFVDKYKASVKCIRALRVNSADFEMKTVIGRGHFGEVRVVRERSSGTVYAMKSLRKHETLTQPDIACIYEERDIMAKTASHWLTKLHYAFQDHNNLFFIMDYHPGGDLLSLLSRYDEVFEEDMARFYIAEITVALHDLHTMGYIHRDVKPENVLIDINGHIKLADFGSAAKLSWDNRVHAGMKMPVGTPDYVSPELLHSINSDCHKKYGTEVDWWSMGVCAYEMFYGKTPFTDGNESIMNTYSNIMNYKEQLKFVGGSVSQEAIEFIKSLLTDAESRMDYDQITLHSFLSRLHLPSIHQATPPFVPSIVGIDDTSNFDEFDSVKSQPCIEDLRPHRGPFSGKDLPFVGFTFTKPATQLPSTPTQLPSTPTQTTASKAVQDDVINMAVLPTTWSSGQTNGLEVTLTVKLEELQSYKDKVHKLELSECLLQSDIATLQQQCQSRDHDLSQFLVEKTVVEQDMHTYKQRYQKVADDLEKEMEERKVLDERTQKIWSDIKDMSFEARQIEEEFTQTELDHLQEAVAQLEFEKEAIAKKLQKRDKQLSVSQLDLEKVRAQLAEMQHKVDRERRKSVDWQKRDLQLHEEREKVWSKQVEDQNIQISSLTHKLQELEDLISTQTSKEVHCCGSAKTQEKIMEVVNKLDRRRSDEKAWKVKERALNDQIEDLEGRLELYRNRGLLSRQPDIQTRDKVTSNQEEVSQQRVTINELKNTIQKYVDNEKDKSQMQATQDSQIQQLQSDVKRMKKEECERQAECDKYRRDLDSASVRKTRLDKELGDMKDSHTLEIEKSEKKLGELRQVHTQCEGEQDKLGREVALLEKKLQTKEMTIQQLEQSLEAEKNVVKERLQSNKRLSNEKISATRICDLQQEKDFLDSKVKALEVKLATAAPPTSNTGLTGVSKEQLTQLKEGGKKKDSQIKALMTELEESSTMLVKSEIKITELQRRGVELEGQLGAVQTRLTAGVAQVEHKLTDTQTEKKLLEGKIQVLQDENRKMKSDDVTTNYNALVITHKNLEASLSGETREKRRALMDVESVRGELATKTHHLDLEMKKVEAWRVACAELEAQNSDLEVLFTTFKEQKDQTVSQKEHLEKVTQEKLHEIEEARIKLQSEHKAKSVMIEKLNLLKSQLNNTNAVHEREVESLTDQLTHEQSDSDTLTKQLVELEEQKTSQETLLKSQQKNIQLERHETMKVKEEISSHITANHTLRKDNLELRQKLDEAMDKFELIFGEKVTLENVVEKLEGSHFVEKYRFESTIDQQMKLINYLATKTEETPKKKKLFGKNKDSPALPIVQPGMKELHASLELEHKRCVKLHEQVERLRRENNKLSHDSLQKKGPSLMMKSLSSSKASTTPLRLTFMSNLTQSPTSQQSPLSLLTPRVHPANRSYKAPTKQRMHHKIPHRFVVGLNTQPTKCGVCLGGVTFVKQAAKCQECRMVCHPKCVVSAIATCGFPSDYVQHFTHITSKMAVDKLRSTDSDDAHTIMEGWIKIPRCNKPGWEKKWGRMEGTELLIFHDETSKKHIDSFDLSASADDDVAIHSAVTSAEMSNTASTDLPYIMRLDRQPHTTCWPERHLYIMTLSFPEKQKWVATFEAALSHSSKHTRHDHAKLETRTLLRLEGEKKLEMNCSLVLGDRLLLGAEEGLYSYPSVTSPQEGVIQLDACGSITQIMCLPSVGVIVMLVGQDRRLTIVDKSDIERKINGECAVLPSRPVDDITGCTVFDASVWRQTLYLCVGMATTVCIMTYNPSINNFCLRQELDICEPCSCVTIADNYAIVGSNKFYRVDLEHPTALEFIDQHDNSLAFAAFGAAIHNSFPLAVVQVTSDSSLKEFLLCFHEFGVYVTADGRRSRPADLKWSGVPLHFTYSEPYLYVTYFTGIQTTHVPSDSGQLKGDQKTKKMSCPRFLGHSPHSGAAYFASNNLNSTEVTLVYADYKHGDQGSVTSLDSLASDKENSGVYDDTRRGKIRKSDTISLTSDTRTPPPSPPRKREKH